MKTTLKVLIVAGLVAMTTAFTGVTVFSVTDEARGLTNMHPALVVDP